MSAHLTLTDDPLKQWQAAAKYFEETVTDLDLYCKGLEAWIKGRSCDEEGKPIESVGEIERRLHVETKVKVTKGIDEPFGQYAISACAIFPKQIETQSGSKILIKAYVAMLDRKKYYSQTGIDCNNSVIHRGICKRRALGISILVDDHTISVEDLPTEPGMEDFNYDYNEWQKVSFGANRQEISNSTEPTPTFSQTSHTVPTFPLGSHTVPYWEDQNRQLPPFNHPDVDWENSYSQYSRDFTMFDPLSGETLQTQDPVSLGWMYPNSLYPDGPIENPDQQAQWLYPSSSYASGPNFFGCNER